MTKEMLCKVVPSGAPFKGNSEIVLIDGEDPEVDKGLLSAVDAKTHAEHQAQRRSDQKDVRAKLLPYFAWAKKALGRERFISYNKANNQRADTMVYSMWEAVNAKQLSRAYLFGEFAVLKLGGIEIPQGMSYGGRNLDFADLDFLTITGEYHGSRYAEISYSSSRYLCIQKAELPFVRFHQCSVEGLKYVDSKIQDHYFEQTAVGHVQFENCSIYRLEFTQSTVLPVFNGGTLKDVRFEPVRGSGFHRSNSETFRLLRIAAQANGLRGEASEFFYQERTFQRKASWAPYRDYRDKFPSYVGPVRDIWSQYEMGRMSKQQAWLQLRRLGLFYVYLAKPKYLWNFLRVKIQWGVSLLDWLIWGYGERPLRVVTSALAIVFSYSLVYSAGKESLLLDKQPIQSWGDALYMSLVTFTTLGYGDVLPATGAMRMVCGSEAMLGAFTMGLVVAAFSNRNRY